MDCLEAQAAISEALDGAALDADVLDAAKQHCRECADCASFVSALNLVKRAPLPEPPSDLADRVMAAVRRESAAEQALARAAAAALAAKAGVAAAAGDGARAGTVDVPSGRATRAEGSPPIRLGGRRPRPAVLAAWVAAAAVLVAGIGTVGVMGIRVMSPGSPAASSKVIAGAESAPRAAGSADLATSPATEDTTAGSTTGAVVSAGPSFIVFNGVAYSLVGPSAVEKGQLTLLGTTKTSLGGGASRARDVMGASGVAGVYVADDQGDLLEFQPLERRFEERTYQLRSADVASFGIWPELPSTIAEPTSPDGSPVFSAAGVDSSGVTIYRRTTSTVAEGIAVAPGASATDPGTGNPNWTWWTPAP